MLFYKDPAGTLDVSIPWYLSEGDTISSSTWESTPDDLTLENEDFSNDVEPKTATVRAADGTLDTDYSLANTVVTTEGRTEVQTATVRVGREVVPVEGILRSLPGGDGFDIQEAREIVEGWKGRVTASQGGSFVDEPYARSVIRRGAKSEIWGEILRQSGHLTADETTREEDKAEKLLKEYDAASATEAEVGQKVTMRGLERG
jgi:hypothetical protein